MAQLASCFNLPRKPLDNSRVVTPVSCQDHADARRSALSSP
jgi:hypothetical protein